MSKKEIFSFPCIEFFVEDKLKLDLKIFVKVITINLITKF